MKNIYKTDLETLIKEAESGNIEAQCLLASKFHQGTDEVEKDCIKAVFWYTKVMENECNASISNLEKNIDFDSYFEEFLNSDLDIALSEMICRNEAAFKLGEIFYWGEDRGERDRSKAVYWYTEAAKYDDIYGEAHLKLGNCYYYGEGTSQDYDKAVDNYRTAALFNNNAEAQWRLGLCYKDGTGISTNKEEAFACFLSASENEDPSVMAQFELAQCFYYGIGTGQDMEHAKHWYQKAAEEQHLYAIEMLKEFDDD